MKRISYLTAVIAVVSLFGCTKQGPAGPAGPPGAQGNANVQSFVFPAQSFTANEVITFAVPAITQLVIDSGAVVVYARLTNGSETDGWTELPRMFEAESILPWDITVGHASAYANFNSSLVAPFDFKVAVIGGQ
jgi:hypothetical protein